MNLEQRIGVLTKLGDYMLSNEQSWRDAKEKASYENGWFIPDFIDLAVRNIAENILRQNVLEKWVANYQLSGGLSVTSAVACR